MRGTPYVAALTVLLLSAASPAGAQDQKRFLEEERRREMDRRPPLDEDMKQPLLWDAGGWLHLQFDHLDDPPFSDTRTDRYVDLRLWGMLQVDRTYTAFLRLQADYVDFNSGEQFHTSDDNQARLRVDQAWVEGDWTESGRGFTLKIGKEFLSMGSGLLFNDVAYAVQGTYDAERFAVRGWIAHSRFSEPDIDQSLPKPNESRRAFLGIEADYLITGSHRAYGMVLVERDFNREQVAAQDWEYDANYIGVGGRGTIVDGWGYSAEAIFEFGRTAAAGSTETDPIAAFAFLLTTDYQFQGPMEPVVRLQYMFGSGDDDRVSPSDMAAGNEAGTTDTSFLPFGFIQTGYSLFPRVSNIHILRLGGSIRPFATTELFHKFEVGLYGYLYRKAVASELISDSRAFLDSTDVGQEIDVFLRWRILSDLGVSLNYGCFFPGKAYQEDSPRNFFTAGMTYAF
jgi:hypothetical protein